MLHTKSYASEKGHEIYLELHRALSALLMKNRFIRRLTHTGLSRAEVHTLIEVAAGKAMTIKYLRPMLGMDQSSVSRLIKGLIADELLEAKQSKKDKRLKILNLTKKGEKTIALIDDVAGSIFQSFIKNLSQDEANILLNFYTELANHYEQPQCDERKQEHVIRKEQRRVSRALGVLSKNVFESGLTSAQWHIFTEICHSSYPLNPKLLSKHHNLPANSLSILLEKLEEKKFIERRQATHDSRFIELHATKKGREHLIEVEIKNAKLLEEILKDYPIEKERELLNIMQKYIGEPPYTIYSNLPTQFEVKKLKTKQERKEARAFALVKLVKREHAQFAPCHMLIDSSHVFGLFDKDKTLCAVCEILQHGSPPELSLLASRKRISPNIAFVFLQEVLEKLKADKKINELSVSFEPAKRLLQKGGVSISHGRVKLF